MNSYYHEITISFNWWMIFFVASVTLSALIGVCQYRIYEKETRRVRRRYNNRLLLFTTMVTTIIFTVMFVVESGIGLLQFLDNLLSKTDSPAWSIFLLLPALAFIIAIFAYIVFGVGTLVSNARLGYLIKKIHSKKIRHKEAIVRAPRI